MTAFVVALAFGQDAPWEAPLAGPAVAVAEPPGSGAGESSFGVQGVAIQEIGGSSGLSVSQASIVGGDGGTHAFLALGQVRWDRFKVDATLPYAAYRTDDGRRGDLGNLAVGLSLLEEGADPEWQIGATLVLRTGDAWSWTNDATQLWPENGIDLVYQRRLGDAPLHGAVRTSAGLHLPAAWSPYPEVYARLDIAGLVEHDVGDRAGLLGELALTWWDVSPVDVSALVRVDPVDRMRIRGGITLPVASWAGWQPANVPAGARESTLRLELQLR